MNNFISVHLLVYAWIIHLPQCTVRNTEFLRKLVSVPKYRASRQYLVMATTLKVFLWSHTSTGIVMTLSFRRQIHEILARPTLATCWTRWWTVTLFVLDMWNLEFLFLFFQWCTLNIDVIWWALSVLKMYYPAQGIKSCPSSDITVLGEPQPVPKSSSTVLDLVTYVSSSSRPHSLDLPQLTQATSPRVFYTSSAFWFT
jgi:hypothetical protein